MIERLKTYLQALAPKGIALAYSGGVDSTLLLAVLGQMRRERPFAAVALTMHTLLHNDDEIAESEQLAKDFGIEQKVFSFNPFTLDEVRNNRIDRCYHCKKAIFTQFGDYMAQQGLGCLIDGTNADDLHVYRPGRKALRELGVISPLAELGFGKKEIRQMSAELGLPTASKPAAPCLATRFAYNTLLDDALVRRVANGEKLLKQMFPQVKNLRLRMQGDCARIEVDAEYIPALAAQAATIAQALKALGFVYVTLDLEGFRSGSFDVGLKGN